MRLTRLSVGILCGVLFGLADVGMTVFGNHPEMTKSMLLQAFSSRFAIGLLAANVSLGLPPVASGALVGLLISLPDAFGLKTYIGVLGTGVLFGALTGLATQMWAAAPGR